MKACWKNGDVAPLILDLGTRCFSPRKQPLITIDRRLGGPQSRSGGGGEEKNSQLLPGLEPPIIHT
jgi:hypothetical protein